MAEREPDDDGVVELWPTVMMRRTLPGHAAANETLVALILDLDRRRAEMTTDYRADNFMAMDDPAVDWLRQCINKTTQDYFTRCGMTYAIDSGSPEALKCLQYCRNCCRCNMAGSSSCFDPSSNSSSQCGNYPC